MEDIRKGLTQIEERIAYLEAVRGAAVAANLAGPREQLNRLKAAIFDLEQGDLVRQLAELREAVAFLEARCEEALTPMDRVRIVRNPLRFTLQDILENVYDDYTELGGAEEVSIDPAVVAAKATIVRQVNGKMRVQHVMVIGHEKGHGEEYRNGGSAKPWGNEKALRFMRVAETEGIPIHFYNFTPGAFPVEDYPGAAQQIARNLYAMARLRVPSITVISEGGSGGAEAVGLADMRLMFSHGYYSVISPEGAAAIEGKVREGEKAPAELVEACAQRLHITAEDNLRLGTIDRIIPEPPMGARRDDFTFFKRVRSEVIKATDEVVLQTKSLRAFRAWELQRRRAAAEEEGSEIAILNSWELDGDEVRRLLRLRARKYRNMALAGVGGLPSPPVAMARRAIGQIEKVYYGLRFDLLRRPQKQVEKVIQDVSGEGSVLLQRIKAPLTSAYDFITRKRNNDNRPALPAADDAERRLAAPAYGPPYTSPLANEDRTVTCPNAERYGCRDLWVPDLYGEFCGVCENCGHHFPLEYQWYLNNLFDRGSIREFNAGLRATNPLGFPGFDDKLEATRRRTGRNSAMITFEARVLGIELVVALLYSDFRNGTVGATEGEKFVQACEKAQIKRRPLLAYVHTTGGIRIHEGTLGVIQMPKCTMAVRHYIDAGGLYIVVYDNNSYAGPVASFLGCSNYQFAIRSSRIGFAGARVIRDTTGEDVPPDYHSAKNALSRGHIHGIWDRREFRRNLYRALTTMGGRKLYYR